LQSSICVSWFYILASDDACQMPFVPIVRWRPNVGFTGSGGAGYAPLPTQMIAGKSRADSQAA
ncbi:MAG: hypothetical protein D6694_10100, partial [Gammaproteobacteria bacterium]